MKNRIALLFCALPFAAMAQIPVKTRTYIDDSLVVPREHNVDFINLRLDVSFEPEKGLVKGTVTHRFTPLQQKVDSIWLDGPGITVKGATLNGKDVRYNTQANGIWIYTGTSLTWNEKDSMTIRYEASPRKGLYFIGWNDPNNISRKQIWSQGQGIDNRNWIPMYDEMNDKITTEMNVTFDGSYSVLSNGKKVKVKDNSDGTKTWMYRMSHPYAPYLIMLGIGKYEVKESKSAGGTPMAFWYYPEWKNRVEPTYRYSEDMVSFMETETGVKYPWESYSQIPVQDYMFGAMENTTATVYGDFLMVDEKSFNDRAYVGVNAHELAHQWFGDYVTARCDAHHWLQESFATYYNQMYEQKVFGNDYFDWTRRQAQTNAVNETQRNLLPVAHSDAGSVRHYPKGAFVLHMLKNVAGGRDAYNRAIKYYLEQHPYGNVDSEDLLLAFHEKLGLSLDWFWEQWVYHGGEPSYNVNAQSITAASGTMTQFTVEQVQATNDLTGLFKMPFMFEVYYTDGTSDKLQAWVSKKMEIVNVPNKNNKSISYVLFDPNNNVMKSVKFNKSTEWLKAQAQNAQYMLDRYDALVAMRSLPIEQKRDILQACWKKETFHATKGEILKQLMDDPNSVSRSIIKQGLADKDPQVQKRALEATTTILPDFQADYEQLLNGNSYDLVSDALEKLCTDFPASASDYLARTSSLIGTSGRNVEIKRLEIGARLKLNATAQTDLVKYCSSSYEFRTRINAMYALKRLNFCNDDLVKNLCDAVLSPNGRLAGPASEVLKYFYDQAAYKNSIRDYVNKGNWAKWQKDKLNKVLG